MSRIKVILLKSSINLYDLINILIKLFCVAINIIFFLIKAKLLFYLKLVEIQIDNDMLQLSKDIKSFIEKSLELQSDLSKYISILDIIEGLLKALIRLIKDNEEFKKEINEIINGNKTIKKVHRIFYYQNDKISEILKGLSSIKLGKSIEFTPDKDELVMNLKMNLDNLQKQSSVIINLNIDKSVIVELNKCSCSIKKITDMIDMADKVVSKEIMSIIIQLDMLETINLWKLYILITQIQVKYDVILIRVYLLICTILFYAEVTRNMSELFGSLNFESCNAKEFLTKSSEVENYINTVSESINECIKKLATACNKCKGCPGVRKELVDLFETFIKIITWLKFYVNLMMMEILIFKMIILTLIEMTVSSAIVDVLMSEIVKKIANVEDAIPRLMAVDVYLQAFYFIQLRNTSVIFGLSNALKFSASIHKYYYVLLFNLDLINRLIWVIECCIHHLIVFKYTSVGLNSISPLIIDQFKVITDLINVGRCMGTITNKLDLIEKSIKQLNNIQHTVDITNWKDKQISIRKDIKLLNDYIGDINSELSLIKEQVKSTISLRNKLMWAYYYLLILMIEVYGSILYTNNKYRLGIGMGNRYFFGLIMSVMGPCNKQLKFIFWYLFDMWFYVAQLIKVVEATIRLIIVKMGWLKVLTSKLQDHVNKINKGVVELECAIEGVVLRFIRCSLLSLGKHVINTDTNNISNYITKKNNLIKINMINTTCVTISNNINKK